MDVDDWFANAQLCEGGKNIIVKVDYQISNHSMRRFKY